ncbi:hypothetical protein FACS18948_3130 [Clostridia bacterium]|nr:hypothetical protein FACS18948_3130 [Clostridia bacterium]
MITKRARILDTDDLGELEDLESSIKFDIDRAKGLGLDDVAGTLEDALDSLRGELEPLQEKASEEWQEELRYMNREYERSVMP